MSALGLARRIAAAQVPYRSSRKGRLRSIGDRLSDMLNVNDLMGVDPSGRTYSTKGIHEAVSEITRRSRSATSVLTRFTAPTLYFPSGRYKLAYNANNDTLFGNVNVVGENAILELDPGVTAFSNVAYQASFKGLVFMGGLRALAIATGNTDAARIDVELCDALGQTQSVVEADATSNSTLFTWRGGTIITPASGSTQVFLGQSVDKALFADLWVYARGAAKAVWQFAGSGELRGVKCVPYGGQPLSWVDMVGGSLLVTLSQFGGEEGGALRWVRCLTGSSPTTPSSLRLLYNQMFGNSNIVEFFSVPNVTHIAHNEGFDSSQGIIVRPTAPAGDLQNIGGLLSRFDVHDNIGTGAPSAFVANYDALAQASLGLPFASDDDDAISTPPAAADVVLNAPGYTASHGGIATGGGTATVNTASTDELGNTSVLFTAVANGDGGVMSLASAFSGKPAENYTAAISFEVMTAHMVRPQFIASRTTKWPDKPFGRGRHTYPIKLFYDGSSEDDLSINTGPLPAGCAVKITHFTIYRGHRRPRDKRVVLIDSAAPVDPAGFWLKGDRTEFPPAASGAEAAVCVVTGAGGTANQWKTTNTIAA